MAALWRAVGQKHSTDSLIHAVGYFHYPGVQRLLRSSVH